MRHLILSIVLVSTLLLASCEQSGGRFDASPAFNNGPFQACFPEATEVPSEQTTNLAGLLLSDRRVLVPQIINGLRLPTELATIATHDYGRWLSGLDETLPISLVHGDRIYGPNNPMPWNKGYLRSQFSGNINISFDSGLFIFENDSLAVNFLSAEADGDYVVEIEVDPLPKSRVVEESLFLKSDVRYWQQGRDTFSSSLYFRSGSVVVVNTLWISLGNHLWRDRSDMLIQTIYDLSQQAALAMGELATVE